MRLESAMDHLCDFFCSVWIMSILLMHLFFERAVDQGPYLGGDLSPELTDQQLEMVLQSELFREELQTLVAEQLPYNSIGSGLPYGGRGNHCLGTY